MKCLFAIKEEYFTSPKHVIVETSYGEVLVKQKFSNILNCYIGNNFDQYIGSIEGSIYEDETLLIDRIQKLLE